NERPRNSGQRSRSPREAAAGVPNPRRKNNAAKNPSPPREPETAKSQPTSRRRRSKLYVENIEEPASTVTVEEPVVKAEEPPKSVDVPEEPVRVAGRNGDVGFETNDFDDFDMLDAESIVRDTLDADEERAFKPDRSAAVEEARRKRPEREPEPEPVIQPSISRERPIVDIPDEELRIEPQAYETPDVEIPFEIPSRQRVKKGELPKIKHDDMKVMFAEDEPEYNYPPIDLLESGEAEDQSDHARIDREKAQLLEDTLSSFGITAQLTGIAHGPAVTRFELKPAPGIKVSRITSLSDDIALNLAAKSVRIEAPIPGKAAVGVEIPNEKVEMVRLRDVLESQEASKHPSKIAVGLGKDNSGRYIVADIAKMPHVLIAGQTGSGKSVCINAIIASILFRAAPEEVRLILIDPKVVELSIYNDIPHLVCPVVTDPKKAASALDWAVAEMTRRYKQFAERGVRDIKGFNKSLREGEKAMPQMVIIIDELADLMMVSPGEVEDSICRIAQLARACGMHLVIATQRPSVNVITGIIKANIPTRIAFSVASQVDSRTMIDHGGAEKLLGNGDMLFVPNGMKAMRVQGAWVSDEEVHAIVEYIKRPGENAYDPDMIEHMENATRSDAEKEEMGDAYDPKLPEAVEIALELGQVSISMLQRKMRIGYARAGRLIDEMARRGIVSPPDGSKPRSILISHEQARLMFQEDFNDPNYSD
ncbi:MAG: DNA translocase FtsK, partial [bacterium]